MTLSDRLANPRMARHDVQRRLALTSFHYGYRTPLHPGRGERLDRGFALVKPFDLV